MIHRVINRLVFVIEGADQGTLAVTAAQVSNDNTILQVHIKNIFLNTMDIYFNLIHINMFDL